jgi:chemotaxis protein MotB
MSAAGTRGRRRGHEEEHEEPENEERWLVSFADMMTLLFCLFMVLFAISSVNTSKFESLKKSLSHSFNGQILSGGRAVIEKGASSQDTSASSPQPPVPSMMPMDAVTSSIRSARNERSADAAKAEQEAFKRLKARIDRDAKRLGLADKVKTTVRPRGLVVQLLTDGVFFDSGQAELKPAAGEILTRLGRVIRNEGGHPVTVEGYTDDQPISSSQFPSNWELSGARAAGVVRHFIRDGVPTSRLSTAGFAQQHPVAGNDTPQGRSKNRRVEVVLTRLNPTSTQGGTTP